MYKKGNLKFPDPQGYYAINHAGNFEWIDIPFCVCCINQVGAIKAQEFHVIDQVALTPENDLVFIIGNNAYYQENFIVATPDLY